MDASLVQSQTAPALKYFAACDTKQTSIMLSFHVYCHFEFVSKRPVALAARDFSSVDTSPMSRKVGRDESYDGL